MDEKELTPEETATTVMYILRHVHNCGFACGCISAAVGITVCIGGYMVIKKLKNRKKTTNN